MTALVKAAKYGHDDIVRILAEKEAGMQDEHGWSALMLAAEKGHPECLKILASEETGMRDNEGETAMMRSTKKGKILSFLSPFEVGLVDNIG